MYYTVSKVFMSDGTEVTTTETQTVTPPAAVATSPATPAPSPAPVETTRSKPPEELPDDHPLVKAFAATKAELATFRAKANQAEQDELARKQRYEELLPLKIDEATTPLRTELDKAQKELAKRDKALAELQTLYTGLETSVKEAKVQGAVKNAYLASGPITEGADAAFDLIYRTHQDKFVLDGDSVKADGQDLSAFFAELKKAPVYSAMFAAEVKPSGTGTPPTKAVAGAGGSGVATMKAGDMMKRNWGSGDPLQDIIDGKIVVSAE
jgi:hypothetical protein